MPFPNRAQIHSVPIVVVVLLMLLAVACAGEPATPTAPPLPTAESIAATAIPATATTAAPTATSAPPTATPAGATTEPPPTEAPTETPPSMEAPPATEPPTRPRPERSARQPAQSSAAAVFTLGDGSVARYKVEEVLAGTGFKVATGETTDVAGSIAFAADGSVVPEESRIAVQVATLQTDSSRRDGYVRGRTLETDTYPEVVFQPVSVAGLPASPTIAGSVEIAIVGDLTVKDQTRVVTWNGVAEFLGDGSASGSLATEFTFEEFGMTKPRVAVVVSVEDTIRLEIDFAGNFTAP